MDQQTYITSGCIQANMPACSFRIGASGALFPMSKRPNWLHRLLLRALLGIEIIEP